MPFRLARPLAAAALCATSFAFTAGRAAPSITRYRLDLSSKSTVDLTPVGGAEQHSSLDIAGFLTITLTDSAGGRIMRAVLDSIVPDSAGTIPREAFDSARGSSWHALVAKNGRISELTPIDTTIATSQFAGIIAAFFPRVKPGARVGDTWTDTLDFTNSSDNGTTTARAVTNFQAVSMEKREGVKALHITSAFSSARTGTIPSPQGDLSIDGTGTGKGEYFVATDGRYLGGTSSETTTLTIVGGGAPAAIPVTATNTLTVSLLK